MANWLGFIPKVDRDKKIRILPGSDLSLIEASIYQILNTVPGERVHLPAFGSRLKYYVFGIMDEFSAIEIKDDLMEALSNWEDRIIVDDVIVLLPDEMVSDDEFEKIRIHISYVSKQGTKGIQDFVVGF